MSKYKCSEIKFGDYNTIILSNESDGSSFQIALQGATPLKYNILLSGKIFNILDSFLSPSELKEGLGSRCWIMTPFTNRIPDNIYEFNGNKYLMEPNSLNGKVIHGFSYMIPFEINNLEINNQFIEVTLSTKLIRPGIFNGYPFALDLFIKYKLCDSQLDVKIIAENVGDTPMPYSTGWHPYFKTTENGIEHLILSLDSESVILLDQNYIPLPDGLAYGSINDFPQLDFRNIVPAQDRIINDRKIDHCFDKIANDKNGFSTASIYDPDNGLKISLTQKGGVTLIFTGDILTVRPRKSIAIEPLQVITNAFNRSELREAITVLPGQKSTFEFGVKYFIV
ncbi:MAG: aldose epimerase family protein [Ignavibacteriaceae bacterium]